MKKFILLVLVFLIVNSFNVVLARSSYTRGYIRRNGTYVQGHYKTTPNSSKFDNWSTKGNVNPYTGKSGTVDPYRQPSYGSRGINLNTKSNSFRW